MLLYLLVFNKAKYKLIVFSEQKEWKGMEKNKYMYSIAVIAVISNLNPAMSKKTNRFEEHILGLYNLK